MICFCRVRVTDIGIGDVRRRLWMAAGGDRNGASSFDGDSRLEEMHLLTFDVVCWPSWQVVNGERVSSCSRLSIIVLGIFSDEQRSDGRYYDSQQPIVYDAA